MTSKFGYTYADLPSADPQDGSIEASAFKALKVGEMEKIQEQNSCTDETSKDDDLDSDAEMNLEVDQDEQDSEKHPNNTLLRGELTSIKKRLVDLIKSKKQLEANLKNLKNEYEDELTRVRSENIDGGVITLLALRLIDLPCSSRGNEMMEIAAALLDEVDRATSGDMQVNLNEGIEEGYRREMRVRWNEEREKRLFNLEGIVEVLGARVQVLEEQAKIREGYEMNMGNGKGEEAGDSLISRFEFGDGDETSMDNNSTIGEGQSSDTGGSQGRRLKETKKNCMALNEKVDELEQT
ncbi:hypothetical protein V865_007705 [Kwoniella europaea PYCC6329]|uniref:Uncharacterized protein n=1 Tax=Kwoniella europaea PYCC6329 TaxID=1423913 RepID=A0AAX4KUQ9_9TREE